jgi:excisionase family DNA binding protein
MDRLILSSSGSIVICGRIKVTKEQKQALISVREAAKECGRNMETVRRWIWAGKLPAEKLGNQLFIRKEDLAIYCKETTVKYRAEVEPDFSARMKGGQMNQYEFKQSISDTGTSPGSRASLIKKMRILREEIRTRVGNLDAAGTIEQLRQERIDGLTSLR